MSTNEQEIWCAPGGPGVAPRWTSSAKDGVGTAIDRNCRVWFTVSHGIVDEVYHPFIDTANTRDMGLIVTADGFFAEEKRDTTHTIEPLAAGVPGYKIVNTCKHGRFRVTKTIFADPHRDVLLQRIAFEALLGPIGDYRLYALLAPHLGNQGAGNIGSVTDYKGVTMLTARRDDRLLALASSTPFVTTSAGYVGVNDGWQQLRSNSSLIELFTEAGPGNIALTGEIDLAASHGACILALAFGATEDEAALLARSSLLDDFDAMQAEYVQGWTAYQKGCLPLTGPTKAAFPLYSTSTAVLKTHESKRIRGGIVASLSLPWGESKGDSDTAGYHVIWPRDQVEAAGAQLAVGDAAGARETLFYLMGTQNANGQWPQNMWLGGKAYWDAVQADETAFPILLAGLLSRESALGALDPWPTVRRAALFLVKNGPATEQDRWEANAGFSPFTIASIIGALLVAADMADAKSEADLAQYLRETADCWNAQIESWTYVTGTELARQVGVEGYYVRIAPPDVTESGAQAMGKMPLKNKPPGNDEIPAAEMISPDALALVRFGLRSPDDPRIVNTIKAIDATLKSDLATGPGWHRYTRDGYGEKPDGSPYDGQGGLGRCWPLLAGERAHYELSRGDTGEAERLLGVMAEQTSAGGMLPEQVWDSADIPQYELANGRPSGSGMPLVWAHAEMLKLIRSLHDGKVFDTPAPTVTRYRDGKSDSPLVPWRFDLQSRALTAGKKVRIEAAAAGTVRWSGDDWKTSADAAMRETPVGLFVVDLPTGSLPAGAAVNFTFRWAASGSWEGRNFAMAVQAAE